VKGGKAGEARKSSNARFMAGGLAARNDRKRGRYEARLSVATRKSVRDDELGAHRVADDD